MIILDDDDDNINDINDISEDSTISEKNKNCKITFEELLSSVKNKISLTYNELTNKFLKFTDFYEKTYKPKFDKILLSILLKLIGLKIY